MTFLDWNSQNQFNAGTGLPNMNMLQSSVSNGGFQTSLNSYQPNLSDYVTQNFNQSQGINPNGSYNPLSAFSAADGGGSNMFGSLGDWASKNQALIGGGVALLQGINGFYQGNKANKLLERQLNYQMQTGERNFQNQRQMVNSQLADRQRARVASSSSYMGVDEYMKKYGV